MKNYYSFGEISTDEKNDILNQHREIYNGYQTMQPKVANEQPLYVQDFAKDKVGAVVNNKGEVKSYTNVGINESKEAKEVCDECGAMIMDGMCSECNYGHMEEETGHLDDIYNVHDLNPKAGFDYIEGQSNDVDTFEKMYKKETSEDIDADFEYEDPDNEDDPDAMDTQYVTDEEIEEQGGNADDMDVDDVTPAYDFVSDGPIGPYNVNEDDMYGYEPMESAWSEDEMEEQDISGVQGIYGDMKKPYNFDSDGPGQAGPYQRSSWNEEEEEQEEQEEDFEVGEDIKESFIVQKSKIMEMISRMKNFN